MRKFIVLFLVCSLVILSSNLIAKERRGAELVIQKRDGQQVKGELIAVKEKSLLLLDAEGADVSVEIGDIKVVTIVKKSSAAAGVLFGVFIGGAIGAMFGSAVSVEEDEENSVSKSFASGGLRVVPSRTLAIAAGVFIGVIFGALIGGGIGAIVERDVLIQIEGRSEKEIKEALEKLRKKARVPEYQ